MAEIKRKRRTRMYEPWGYQDQNNYESSEVIQENDLDSFFADVNYSKDDNKIFFYNKDGEEKGALDVSEFVKSDSIIDKVEYKDGILTITFTNGDEVHIDLSELIDKNEFGDGLQVIEGQVSVKRNAESDDYFTVDADGIKIAGIKVDIDAEEARATSAETALDTKINKEITDRTADVDAEENRAKAAEQVLTTNLANEITRATQTEQGLNHRIDVLNDELDSEESARESNDAALTLRITTESNERIAGINTEKERAEAAERTLNLKIDAESERAIQKEIELDERIDEIISGSPIEQLDELIEKLGYKDNDTLQLTNEHEVAFGEWNVSSTSADASGQTVFSVGIGTSADDRKNALEVRKDGSVYMWVEGGYVQINNLLAQLTNEVYDSDANGKH